MGRKGKGGVRLQGQEEKGKGGNRRGRGGEGEEKGRE